MSDGEKPASVLDGVNVENIVVTVERGTDELIAPQPRKRKVLLPHPELLEPVTVQTSSPQQLDITFLTPPASFQSAYDCFTVMENELMKSVTEANQELALLEKLTPPGSFPHYKKIVTETIHDFSHRTNMSWLDVSSAFSITRICKRILLPPRSRNLNIVGRLLGPRGYTLKALQQACRCKIGIYGRGSIPDPEKEENLLRSGDPQYMHLSQPLHCEVIAAGPAHQVFKDFANVLTLLHMACTQREAFEFKGIHFTKAVGCDLNGRSMKSTNNLPRSDVTLPSLLNI